MKKRNVQREKRKKKQSKKRIGRPTKYRKEYCKKIIEFFDIEPTRESEVVTTFKNGTEKVSYEEKPNHLRFFGDFEARIGISHTTMMTWTEKYPEFLAAYTCAKDLQKQHLITCGLLGLYNPIFAKFTAINITDMRDQQNIEIGGSVKIILEDDKE